jgi:hypothetical protein
MFHGPRLCYRRPRKLIRQGFPQQSNDIIRHQVKMMLRSRTLSKSARLSLLRVLRAPCRFEQYKRDGGSVELSPSFACMLTKPNVTDQKLVARVSDSV